MRSRRFTVAAAVVDPARLSRAVPKEDPVSVSRGYTPAVRATATRMGVVLDTIKGSGAGGRVTLGDVHKAAGVPRRPAAAAAAAAVAGLPAFTCSGMDPHRLLQVPPSVRAAVAAAPTLEQASALAAKYAGMSNDDARSALGGDSDVPAHLGGGRWWDDP